MGGGIWALFPFPEQKYPSPPPPPPLPPFISPCPDDSWAQKLSHFPRNWFLYISSSSRLTEHQKRFHLILSLSQLPLPPSGVAGHPHIPKSRRVCEVVDIMRQFSADQPNLQFRLLSLGPSYAIVPLRQQQQQLSPSSPWMTKNVVWSSLFYIHVY